MNKYVFSFWSGPKYYLIEVLEKLMKRHSNDGKNYTLVYLDEKNVNEWIELHPNFNKLSLPHKADYIRVNIIEKYGGIWIDADTIVMTSLTELFSLLEKYNAFYTKENNTTFINGVFGSIKEHHIIQEIKKEIDLKLESLTENPDWTFIGSSILNPILNNHNDYYTLNGLDTIYPVNFDVAENIFLKSPYKDYKKYIRPFQPLVILVNSVYKNFTCNNLTEKKTPINYFIKKSIKNIQQYNYQSTFSVIYDLGFWNGNNQSIPKSGPGSSLDKTVTARDFINNIVSKYNIKSVVDLGCGDLTWIKITNAFSLDYTGIDIVESLIKNHINNYPDKKFYTKNIIMDELPEGDLYIIRDVIFHLKLDDIKTLLINIVKKFKYLLIGNNYNKVNLNEMNMYHFNQRNLLIEPFNVNFNHIIDKIYESENDRDLLLIKNEDS